MALRFFDSPPVVERSSKYASIAAELISNEGRWAKIGAGSISSLQYARKVLPSSIVVKRIKCGSNVYEVWASYKPTLDK